MCDYSLELVASRPAKVEETSWYRRASPTRLRVVLLRQTTITWPFVCFPAPSLLSRRRCGAEPACSSLGGSGARLARFRQVNRAAQTPTMTPLSLPLMGGSCLLTQLCKGQHATVLQLPVTSPVTANEAQRHGSLVTLTGH